ncbi:general odorant-binding protein 84a [Drosophila albomicans]|uniref:General odorant-binding protein 84a n=1 Tax=Drosophila albomicans TaxID=7291 RepID=A0A6P8XRM8_DROAB|nr:general odorant-binding protein 84a [Drosophila albomicans]
MAHFNFFILLLTMSFLFWSVLNGQDVQPEPDDPEVQREKHAEFFAARKACALEFLVPYVRICVALFAVLSLSCVQALEDHAKDNGDIYIINYDSFDGDMDDISTTTEAPRDPDFIDFDEVIRICNASFVTPLSNTILFNTTGKLLDENDRTSMCYFRCFFEKAGLMDNFKLNVELVRKYLWPATGDSIEHCESQAMDETNACVRAYAITQCIMMRALTDARNKPMV